MVRVGVCQSALAWAVVRGWARPKSPPGICRRRNGRDLLVLLMRSPRLRGHGRLLMQTASSPTIRCMHELALPTICRRVNWRLISQVVVALSPRESSAARRALVAEVSSQIERTPREHDGACFRDACAGGRRGLAFRVGAVIEAGTTRVPGAFLPMAATLEPLSQTVLDNRQATFPLGRVQLPVLLYT